MQPLDPGPDGAEWGREEAAALLRLVDQVVLPPPALEGWASRCADEYGAALAVLRSIVADAGEQLHRAASA